MSAAAAPTKLSQLLDFVSARSESLSETPDVSELADFASGCHENFVATYGEESDVHPTPTLMRTLVHLTPIVTMEEAFTTVTVLESQLQLTSPVRLFLVPPTRRRSRSTPSRSWFSPQPSTTTTPPRLPDTASTFPPTSAPSLLQLPSKPAPFSPRSGDSSWPTRTLP